ncbi:MAG TPA: SDR family NAD(P)-dependent oxidoreductase, partial [Candidatus Paceibacterota bacterium]|nr:SDR family NAD(P)-dependent oxidoreductase [Candidatus Paceibacterota bacterium]
NKVIIVTGASDGIGEATAKKLARAGAKVVLAARNDEKLAKLAHELPGSVAVHTDMTQQADIQNLIDRTMEIDGRIDILINNAGQGMMGPAEHVDIDKYKHIMNLNVYGPLYAMQLAIPHMRAEGGGMILNISSRVSKNYYPNLSAYASTKYALNAISLTAREELKKDNIIVSVFHPKMTATSFGKNSANVDPTEAAAFYERAKAAGRDIDTAEQVAEKILEQIISEAPEAEM